MVVVDSVVVVTGSVVVVDGSGVVVVVVDVVDVVVVVDVGGGSTEAGNRSIHAENDVRCIPANATW